MIRTLIAILLVASCSYAEELTVITKQPGAVVVVDSDTFGSCDPLPTPIPIATTAPVNAPVYVLSGASLRMLIQPTDDADQPLDFTGKGFYAGFILAGGTDTITLDPVVTATPGLLDITLPGTETLKMDGRSGFILIRVLEPHDGFFSMITALPIPVQPYPTITRLP